MYVQAGILRADRRQYNQHHAIVLQGRLGTDILSGDTMPLHLHDATWPDLSGPKTDAQGSGQKPLKAPHPTRRGSDKSDAYAIGERARPAGHALDDVTGPAHDRTEPRSPWPT
jgi:hypothetical protein